MKAKSKVRVRAALAALVATAGLLVAACGTGSAAPKNAGDGINPHPAPGAPASDSERQANVEKDVAKLFDLWNAALASGDPKKVAERYAPTAVLLPTASSEIRTTPAQITDYFQHFLERKPHGTKVSTIVDVLDHDTAVDSGVYRFTLTDKKTGVKSDVAARYTYVYEKTDGEWLIVNHHSSVLPSAV